MRGTNELERRNVMIKRMRQNLKVASYDEEIFTVATKIIGTLSSAQKLFFSHFQGEDKIDGEPYKLCLSRQS